MDDVLNNAPCGFVSVADDGSLIVVNQTLQTLLGYTSADLSGKTIGAILTPGGRIFYQTHVFPLLKLQGKVEEIYLSLRSHSGDEVPVLTNAVRRERAGIWINDCVFMPMRQRSLYEDQILQAKRAAEEATRATARLQERERRIADRLQDALRPAHPGEVPGLDIATYYQPALAEASIGGDFFDVFPLDENRFAFVVADLSGKGLAAAAQIATVRHMLRTLLYLGMPLAETITRLNDLITGHHLLEGFATLFVGVFHSSLRTLTYACCGQEPGLLFRADTGLVTELGLTGPIVGGFGATDFEAHSVSLAAGDLFALFTDGLTESGRDYKNLLGITGMKELFQTYAPGAPTAEAVSAHLLAGVEAFATAEGIRDDVCLLIARVT